MDPVWRWRRRRVEWLRVGGHAGDDAQGRRGDGQVLLIQTRCRAIGTGDAEVNPF